MTELAQGYLSLSVGLDHPGAALGKWTEQQQSMMDRAGKAMGQSLSRGVADGTEKAKAAAETARTAFESASKAAVGAAEKREAAARKVQIAEAKLAETQAKYAKDSSQVLTAEDRLASARKAAEKASLASAAAEKKQADASAKAKTAAMEQAEAEKRASAQSSASATQTETAAGRIRSAFSQLGAKIPNPFKQMPTDAVRSGDESGARFSRGFGVRAGIGVEKSGKPMFAGLAGAAKTAGLAIGASFAAQTVKKWGEDSISTFKSVAGQSMSLQRTIGGTITQASQLRTAFQLSGLSAEQADGPMKIFSKNVQAMAAQDKNARDKAIAKARAFGDQIKVLQSSKKQTSELSGRIDELRSKQQLQIDASKQGASAMASLGVIYTDTNGKLLPMSALLPKVADAFKAMPSGPQKTTTALKLFGRSGADMVKMLNKGSIGLKEMSDQSDKLGLTLNGSSTAAIGKAAANQRQYDAAMMGLKVTVGAMLLPTVTRFAVLLNEKVVPALKKGTDFISRHQGAVKALGAGVVILVGSIKALSVAQATFNLIANANPIMLIVTAVAALTAGFTYAYKHSEKFRNVVNGVLSSVKNVALAVGRWFAGPFVNFFKAGWQGAVSAFNGVKGFFTQTIPDVFTGIVSGIKSWVSTIGGLFMSIWHGIQSVFTSGITIIRNIWSGLVAVFAPVARIALNGVVAVFRGVWTMLGGILNVFIGLFTGNWSRMWAGIKSIVFGAGAAVTAIFRTFTSVMLSLGRIFLSGISAAWAATWNWIRAVGVAIWGGIKAIFWGYINGLRLMFSGAMAFFKWVWSAGWNWIKAVGAAVWGGIRAGINGFFNGIRGAFTATVGFIKWVWSGGWKSILSTGSHILGQIRDGIHDVIVNKIPAAFQSGVSAIKRAWDGLQNVAKQPVRFVINTVLNGGLIAGFNWVAGKLGAKGIDPIKLPKGFRRGGYTGDGRPDEIAGPVHRGEYVMDAGVVKRVGGAEQMERIRAGLRAGMWPVGPAADPISPNQDAHHPLALPSALTRTLPVDLRTVIARGPRRGDRGMGGAAGEQAVQWGLGQMGSRDWYRLCLAFVNQAWGRRVAGLNRATARDAMNSVPRRMDGTPPPGAAVFWDTGGAAGHVALSVGDGTELSNDIVAPGLISRVPASDFASKWGAKYMGWFSPDGSQPGADSSWLSKIKGFIGSVAGSALQLFGKFASPVEWIADKMSGLIGKGTSSVLSKFGVNPLTQMVAKVPEKLLSAAKTKIGSLFSPSSSRGASSDMEAWRGLVRQALAFTRIGGGKADEDRWLRQIMSESSGDPRQVQSSSVWDVNVANGDPARGLVQIPKVTWDAFGQGMGSFIPNVYDALKNLIVGMRDAGGSYHNWRNVIGFGHGYAGGTSFVPRDMFAPVAENGIELLAGPQVRALQRGSQVLNNQDTMALLGGQRGPVRVSGKLDITDDGMATIYGWMTDAMDDREAMNRRIGA